MSLRQHIDLPTRKRNRLQARSPKPGIFWCSKCDRNHVALGEKCTECGHREGRPPMKLRELG